MNELLIIVFAGLPFFALMCIADATVAYAEKKGFFK